MASTDEDSWGEPVSGGDIWDLEKEGPLVGTYKGYREVTSDYGVGKLHEFDTESGPVACWGKAHLDRLVKGREGELLKVILTGNKISLGGGRTMIEYEVRSKGRQGPALPAEPLPAGGGGDDSPFVDNGSQTEAMLLRAKRLAIAAKDANVDDDMRGELIEFWSFGETRHARDLTDEQFDGLYKVIQGIRRGKYEVRYEDAGGKRLR